MKYKGELRRAEILIYVMSRENNEFDFRNKKRKQK